MVGQVAAHLGGKDSKADEKVQGETKQPQTKVKSVWSNVLAVRWFMSLVWQKEPIQEQYDQKGVHFNEPGSKQTGTYEIPGRIDPPVRENHGQTR